MQKKLSVGLYPRNDSTSLKWKAGLSLSGTICIECPVQKALVNIE